MLANANVFHGDHHPVSVVEGRKSRNLLKMKDGQVNNHGFVLSCVDGVLSIHGTTSDNNSNSRSFDNSIFVDGETYTLSIDRPLNANIGLMENKTWSFGGRTISPGSTSVTFVYNNLANELLVSVYARAGTVLDYDDVLVQIEAGDVVHPYEPYGVIPSPLYLPAESTASGLTVEVDGTYNDRAEVSVAGRSKQASYRGVNLLDINNGYSDGYSVTKNGVTVGRDGNVYTVGGINTYHDANYSLGFTIAHTDRNPGYLPFIAGETYTISTTSPLPDGFYIGLNTKNKDTGVQISSGGYLYGDGVRTHFTFTCPSVSNGFLFAFFGVLKTATEIQATSFSIQLEKGTVATEWEPYVGGIPSPSPDYPQEIKSVTGPVVLESRGRNLANEASLTYASYSSGIPVVATWQDGMIRSLPYHTTAKTSGVGVIVDAKAGESYTAKYHGSLDFVSVSFAAYPTRDDIHDRQKNIAYADAGGNNANQEVTYTATQDCCVLFLWSAKYYQDNLSYFNPGDIMLERGTVAYPYEPYHSSALSVDLQGSELRSLPDGTQDWLVLTRSGKRWIDKRVGHRIINKIEYVGKTGAGLYYGSVYIDDKDVDHNLGATGNAMCSHYIPQVKNNAYGSIYGYANENKVYLIDERATSAATFNEILAASPVTLDYKLATSAIIPLPDGDPLPTWWPYTRITANGEDITARVRIS